MSWATGAVAAPPLKQCSSVVPALGIHDDQSGHLARRLPERQCGHAGCFRSSIEAEAQSVIRNSCAGPRHSDVECFDQLMRTRSSEACGCGRGTVKEPRVVVRS
jgi:hypothetical protein